jgi:hypothetical protein
VKHDLETLNELKVMSLDDKVAVTQDRLLEFYEHYDGKVYVSFSGGKDSTVLLHIARQIIPDIKAAFSNTGLEYPEIQQFVKTFDNVDILRPKMNFHQVLTEYGYPLISKEVAEAIHYARRNGGGTTKKRKQRELLGQRHQKADAPRDIYETRGGNAKAHKQLLLGEYRRDGLRQRGNSPSSERTWTPGGAFPVQQREMASPCSHAIQDCTVLL